jgi:hypothetical protein
VAKKFSKTSVATNFLLLILKNLIDENTKNSITLAL